MLTHRLVKFYKKNQFKSCANFYKSSWNLHYFPDFSQGRKFITQSCFYSTNSKSSEANRIVTIPNLLCVYRIGMAPIISYQLISENYILAFGLMTTAALSDMIDGFIARNFKNQKSLVGSFLDPFADKILVFSLSMSLWYIDLLPSYLMGLFVSRDIILFLGATYFRYKTLEKVGSLQDVFNPKVKSAMAEPLLISKVNTLLQFVLLCSTMCVPIFGYHDSPYLFALQLICATTTIGSGVAYGSSKQFRDLFKR